MSRVTTSLAIAILLVSVAGCKKKQGAAAGADDKAAPAPAADDKAAPAAAADDKAAPAAAADDKAAPPAAATGHCPDGFTENVKGGFCVKLPPGLGGDGGPGMDLGNHRMQFGYAGEQTGVTIVVADINQYFDENLAGLPKDCGACKGKASALTKLPNGGYVTFENNNGDGRNSIESMIKNDKKTIDCTAVRLASSDKPPTEADAFDVCKTISLVP